MWVTIYTLEITGSKFDKRQHVGGHGKAAGRAFAGRPSLQWEEEAVTNGRRGGKVYSVCVIQ